MFPDGNPMLRDGQTGDWIGTFLGHKGAVWSARLTKDASKAVTGSADFTAKVWDTFTGDALHSFSHGHIIRSADFSDDGTRIVTGGVEKKLRIFDLYRPDAPPLEADGHAGTIKSVAFDERRNVILSAGEDKVIRVWDLRTFKQVTTLDADDAITSMNLSSDGKYITSTAGSHAYFWDASNYHLAKSYVTQHDVPSVSLHPDHSRFVAGSMGTDLWVRIYDFETGKELEVYKGHHGAIHTVSYSPDGEIYATGSGWHDKALADDSRQVVRPLAEQSEGGREWQWAGLSRWVGL
ncbi:WD40-repeat-containing domain protein [Jimgerdemannia flammicorona]|uniref:Serine-threonine kinase receptor-associated protein n=1 Tax=Jimgerdemannia flammicorona TaxID=994334 RepID=A0A433CZ42_9FUNG|nr:WD40-repeat-containing domain protein [Jimgerdemannia flammicorona]